MLSKCEKTKESGLSPNLKSTFAVVFSLPPLQMVSKHEKTKVFFFSPNLPILGEKW